MPERSWFHDTVRRMRRRVGLWRGTEPPGRLEIRCARRELGGWWICPEALREGDVAYSFGLGPELPFERALLDDYGVRLFAFDPNPAAAEWVANGVGTPGALRLVAVGVAGHDEVSEPDAAPAAAPRAEEARYRVLRLPNIMRMLGHRRLDLIKLDVQGAEYDAIRDLVRIDVDVRQLLVRFHHGENGIGTEQTTEALEVLHAHGYRVFYISPDGHEYSFIRTDFAGS